MRRSRILCVDDQYGIRTLLREIFKDEYEVMTVETGEKSIEVVKTFKPHIVILDMNLKTMKGTDVLKAMRKFDKNITSIILTAYMDLNTIEEIQMTNPNMVISKPFDVKELKEKVKLLTSPPYLELACC